MTKIHNIIRVLRGKKPVYEFTKVKSSDGKREYIINKTRKTCTCPDFQYRRAGTKEICKHLRGVV